MASPHRPDTDALRRALAAIQDLRTRLEAAERGGREPIAIVGAGCRFPGAVAGPEQYWDLLEGGTSAISEVPDSRWDVDAYYDPDPERPGRAYTRDGGFALDVDRFDARFFEISPREARAMDPQHRLLLETSWEALEHGAINPGSLRGQSVGVFVGIAAPPDYSAVLTASPATMGNPYAASGTAVSIAAGRLAYFLGVHGPALATDTACSSSLVAIHLAMQALRRRECDMALAAGVSAMLSPTTTVLLCQARMLSPTGRCHTFDASADGYVRGEGCGVLVLKRLRDAQAAGDRILAVLRGSAINQDGRSSGLTAPNGAAQEALIRAALRDANVEPDDVAYVEAHGTGTRLGDPIEVHALRAVFEAGRSADRPLLVGSVKTNIGHLEAAAGIAGVLKVVGALQRDRIPPHLNFTTPNPEIDWGTGALQVTTDAAAWPTAGRRRIAGVSSFGFSGTNAHIVIEEAPPQPRSADETASSLLTLSARTPEALAAAAARLEAHLACHEERLGDVCFSMTVGRAAFEHRAAMVVTSTDQARARLRELASGDTTHVALRAGSPGKKPRVAFLYTGQGAQYVGMGRQLFESSPTFREALLECDAALEPIEGRRLLEWLFDDSPAAAARIDRTLYAQPALFCLEIALTKLWTSWGIEPVAVLGHSVGEIAAACAAGAMSLADGLRLIAARARLMQAQPDGGGMLAVRAPLDAVIPDAERHRDRVSVAAINGPDDVVLSGARAALDELAAGFRSRGLGATFLRVSHAFHSPLMRSVVEPFREIARTIECRAPRWRLISNLTGQPLGAAPLDADYWGRHLLEPVRFGPSIETLLSLKVDVFLEIGPHPVLVGMAGRRPPGDVDVAWVASLRRGRDDRQSLLAALGELYLRGATYDAREVARPAVPAKVALPTYPFERQRYWAEPGATVDAIGARASVRSAASGELIIQQDVSVDSSPWLEQHRVYGAACYPAAGYLTLVLQACEEAETGPVEIQSFVIEQPLVFDIGRHRAVQVILTPDSPGRYRCAIFATPDERPTGWQRIAHCDIATSSPAVRMDEARPPLSADGRSLDVPAIYEAIQAAGVTYGPAFRPLRTLAVEGEDVVAGMVAGRTEDGILRPALFDAAIFQVVGAAWIAVSGASTRGDAFLPIGIERVRVGELDHVNALTCRARFRRTPNETDTSIVADLQAWDDRGALVIDAVGVSARRAPRQAIVAALQRSNDLLYELAWRPAPAVVAGALAGSTWLVLADRMGIGARVAETVQRSGGTATCVSMDSVVAEGGAGAVRALIEHTAEARLTTVVGLWAVDGAGAADVAAQANVLAAVTLELIQTVADLADAGKPVRALIATRGAVGPEPARNEGLAGAPVWGMLRVARSERPDLQLHVVDLDADSTVAEAAQVVLDHGSAVSPVEWQSVYRTGRALVPRLVRMRPEPPDRLDVPDEPWQLTIDAPGVLDDLRLSPMQPGPPGAGEVQVQVSASGLNFRDVLNALGMYPGGGPLGSEVAGRVVAVGPGVTRVAPGDRVMAITARGFCSLVNTRDVFVRRIPVAWTDEDAATIPIVHLTAEYALRAIARLAPGERVLIHAGAGGVGMAAIRIARDIGARIFATAGSETKRLLLRDMGVAHVMDSRSLDFADEIRRVTQGEGIDVVLNSLTGEAIDRGFSVLREGGRFLEIGKAEWRNADEVHRAWPGIRYVIVDLTRVIREEPETIGAMLDRTGEAMEAGRVSPLPKRVFGIDQARDAFRFMAQARHVGKVVIANRPAPGRCRPDATYAITGGGGALGLETARWLAGRGARHLVLLGRSQPSAATTEVMTALANEDVDVRFVSLDVARLDDVVTFVEALPPDRPLRGIVHAAGVLDDGMLTDLTPGRLGAVMAPKVDGAWNLHLATSGRDLDFFTLFASSSGVLGSPGQANYAAANVFLDSLAGYRRALGFTGQSVDWGPWSVGMAARTAGPGRERGGAASVSALEPDVAFAAFARAQDADRPQVVVLKADWRELWRVRGADWPDLLSELAPDGHTDAPRVPAGTSTRSEPAIRALPPEERPAAIAARVRDHVRAVLALEATTPLADDQELVELGMDSLVAVELVNRLKQMCDMPLPATLALEHPTIGRLAAHLESLLADQAATATGVRPRAAVPDAGPAALLDRLSELSEAEIDAALAELDHDER